MSHLFTGDEGDIVVSDKDGAYIIWAIGKLDKDLKPTFHRLYPKHNIKINFNRQQEELNCQAFTSVQHPKRCARLSFQNLSNILKLSIKLAVFYDK